MPSQRADCRSGQQHVEWADQGLRDEALARVSAKFEPRTVPATSA